MLEKKKLIETINSLRDELYLQEDYKKSFEKLLIVNKDLEKRLENLEETIYHLSEKIKFLKKMYGG